MLFSSLEAVYDPSKALDQQDPEPDEAQAESGGGSVKKKPAGAGGTFRAFVRREVGGKKGEYLYDVMLGKQSRQYSCGYWKKDTKTLEEAQKNKIQHIIKKLDIKKNQTIL